MLELHCAAQDDGNSDSRHNQPAVKKIYRQKSEGRHKPAMQDAWRACFLAVAGEEIALYMNLAFLFLQVITQAYIWHHQSKADLHEGG